MSGWRVRQVTVTLASDLHCGARPLGFVARTLPFVPAHIPWYAMTAALVAASGWPDRFDSYARMEALLAHSLRFTPFFPLDDEDRPLFPWGDGHRLIESNLLGAQYGVALSYDSRGARKNHLFETEVLLARSRSGRPTRLRGYCFWRPGRHDGLLIDADASFAGHGLAALLLRGQWGGQRNKGLGALRGVTLDDAGGDTAFFHSLDLAGENPVLYWPATAANRAPYYLEYEPRLADRVRGRLMPLTGRRFVRDLGPGRAMEAVVCVWEPGWFAADVPDGADPYWSLVMADRRTVRWAADNQAPAG